MTSVNQSSRQSGYRKYLIWVIPFIAFAALMLLMKASGNGQVQLPPTQAKKHPVNVMAVEWHDKYKQKRLVVGRAEAQQTSAISFDLAGSVEGVFVNEGQTVVKGQILAELDDQRLIAQMNELSAMLNRVTSEANLAKISLKRVADLVNKKLESAQRLDEAKESLNVAEAYVDEMIARKKTLLVEMSKTKLIAPFSGSLVNRLVDEGAVVSIGQPLFTLQQNAELEVRFALSADYASKLAVDQIMKLTFQSGKSNVVTGYVKSIAQQRRLATRTVDVIMELNERNLAILPGDLLSMDVSSDIDSKGFWVPRKALVSGVRGLWSLFSVNEIDEEHFIQTKLVEIIYADDVYAYVNGALRNGESVVADGVQRLIPGQKVIINSNSRALHNMTLGTL